MRNSASSDLGAALEAAIADYADRNPNSHAMYQRACESMPGGNTRSNLYFSPFPVYFMQGEGAYLTDADGHSYVDFLGEYTAGVYGHSHPRILKALAEVSALGLSLGGPNRWEGQLAATLCGRFPALERVRFTNSGTEANLFALGTARAFTGRKKLIVFDGGYHGGALTFTSPDHPLTVPLDYLIARYNDLDSVRALLEQNPGEVAAVLVEPMLSSGGCIPATSEFLHGLRALTLQHGALLIFDEVVTSRLAPNGIHGELGLKPDLLTLGKYIGGGLSFGAFGGRADIMALLDPSHPKAITHAGTFNNNTLTMGVGAVAISEVFTPQAAAQLCARGDQLRSELNQLARRADLAMQFTGRGSSMNLHFSAAPVARPNPDTRGHVQERTLYFFHMVQQGIYLAPRGMLNLSLAHEENHVAAVVSATQSFIDRYADILPGGNQA